MKLKIDIINGSVHYNNKPLKFQYKLKPSHFKGVAKDITKIIKEHVKQNHFQVKKEVKGDYQWHPTSRREGYYTFSPTKTIIKSGLWAEQPEVISIYNYIHGTNTFIINDPKLQKQIQDYLLQIGAKL